MSDSGLETAVALRRAVEALSRAEWDAVRRECDLVDAGADAAPDLRGEALLLRAIARQADGDTGGALADACGAFLAWRSADRGWLAGRLLSLGGLLAASGDAEGVRRYVDLAVTAARAGLPPAAAAEIAAAAAGVLASAGLDREAEQIWRVCLGWAPQAPPALALINLARLELEEGDLGSTLARLERALAVSSDYALRAHAVAVGLDMCAMLAEAGDLSAAAATIDRLARLLGADAPEALRMAHAAVEHDRGIAALEAGHLEEAAERFADAAGSGSGSVVMATALMSLAGVESQFGQAASAVDHVRRAAAATEDPDQIAAAAVLARAIADEALGRGDREVAAVGYSLGAGLFREAGQGRLADLVAAQADAAQR